MHVPKRQGKKDAFIGREEKEVGKAIVNRVHGFSLAESLPGKKSRLSSCWVQLPLQGMRTPPSVY